MTSSQTVMVAVRQRSVTPSQPVEGKGKIQSSDSYSSGFTRCLVLRNDSYATPKYSDELQNALHAYFESWGLLDHARLAEWRIDHLGTRVAHAFNTFIPWCQDLSVNLEGARVLEIGCGTGSSTTALAAHAQYVLACDIDQPSINVAQIRLQEDGFSHRVRFLRTDTDFSQLASLAEEFDVAVLYGVLEHMSPDERQKLFRIVWNLLPRSGRLVIYETPNRLCLKDVHTTGLIGWPWLSPNLALRYGKWRRKLPPDTDLARMYRLGFGLTYYELKNLLKQSAAQYSVRFRYAREPLWQRAIIKASALIFNIPRWAFLRNLDLVIEKC
jgi:2-polyprenyl-3-methyl-5-hydroxy-6-metoxy-1,4-benzoquinol methylase